MSEVAAKPGPTDVTLGPLALALLYGQQFIVACNSVSMNLMTSRAALDLKTSLTGGTGEDSCLASHASSHPA
jgi:hypothetical protein